MAYVFDALKHDRPQPILHLFVSLLFISFTTTNEIEESKIFKRKKKKKKRPRRKTERDFLSSYQYIFAPIDNDTKEDSLMINHFQIVFDELHDALTSKNTFILYPCHLSCFLSTIVVLSRRIDISLYSYEQWRFTNRPTRLTMSFNSHRTTVII